VSVKLKESGLGIHPVVCDPGSDVRVKTASKPYIYKEAFVVTPRCDSHTPNRNCSGAHITGNGRKDGASDANT